MIWGKIGIRYYPSNIRKRYACGRGSVFVWCGISLGGLIDLHIFPRGTMNAEVYRDDILDAFEHLHAAAIGDALLLQDDNARQCRARIVDDYLQQEAIMLMEWPAQFLDLNPMEQVWNASGRRLAALSLPSQTLAALVTALEEQWLSLPMELIDRMIESITHRYMCCIAFRDDHIPY